VPEALLDDLGVNPGLKSEGRGGVPQVVEPEDGDAGALAGPGEGVTEALGVPAGTVLTGEDEVTPGSTGTRRRPEAVFGSRWTTL
jgi:hypothetical protein